MLIVDSQVHIWAAHSTHRPWPADQFHRPERLRSFSADDLLREMNAAGVRRAILVPPSYEGGRNDLVLQAASRHPDRFAAMGRLALDRPDSPYLLESWLRQPGMLGLRLNVFNAPEKILLTDDSAAWFWPAVERIGIPLMVLATGVLDPIEKVAERHPGLKIILDHFSLHREAHQPPGIDQAAIRKLMIISRLPNVAVKASALPLFSDEEYPFPGLHEPMRRVFDAFGPERFFWGTDFTRLSCSYKQAVTMFTEELPWLTGDDKEKVMGLGLCEWLNWPPEKEA